MNFVLEMDAAGDVAQAGGKAAALTRLKTAGFAPPAFFVIRSEAFSSSATEPVLVDDARDQIESAVAKLGPGPFAVRSSGRAEDGIDKSHAGQFLSLLNIPASGVLTAAGQVWASGFSETIAEYRRVHHIDEIDPPAIIVQHMVAARAAGVAFSADPVTGRRGRVVISAIDGLGDALVSGEVDGEDWIVEADTHAVLSGPENPVVLSPSDVTAVADLAVRIELAFGVPQDIEWAFLGKDIFILQARPITTALRAPAMPDAAITIFDNSNIVESYPGLVSPLTYSFAQYAYARVYQAFVRLLGVSEDAIASNTQVFENMLGRIDGRVYYNLVNWYRALAMLPGFSLNRAHMETMMGVSEPLPNSITQTIGPQPAAGWQRWLEYGRVGRVGVRLVWQAIRLPRTVRAFYDRLDEALGKNALDLNTAPLTALAGEYRRIETQLLDKWDAPLVNDFLCMMAFGASRKLLAKWLGRDGEELHNHVMIGQGDIISAEPAKRIAALGRQVAAVDGLAGRLANNGLAAVDEHPEIAAGFAAYIEKFGDRCAQELKLESITLDEDPSALVAAVAAAARRGDIAHKQAAEAPRLGMLFKGKPMRRLAAGWMITWTKARVRDRENLRFERTRIFGRARRVFLAMGRELSALDYLNDPRDIFYLTVAEVLGAIEGFGMTQNLKPLVAARKVEFEAASERDDPAERISVSGAAINVEIGGAPAEYVADESDLVRLGTGCSAGRVQAVARVVRDPRTEHLNPGEILVARHTDPGWIAVFANASAIVVERGSLLSHSAIVARELGIPCVVGLKDATRWISSGQTLSVDGAAGEVEIIA